MSSSARLMDSVSLRRRYSGVKSESEGGIGRMFSVRLKRRAVSSVVPWSGR
ncbi:MAG: hypothetical protein V9G12_22790 [Microthrixaceae bacterium]